MEDPDEDLPDEVSLVDVRVLSRYYLELTFAAGDVRVIDFELLMWDPLYEPLRADYSLFCDVAVDAGTGTLTWSTGSDWTARELYEHSKPAVPRSAGQ